MFFFKGKLNSMFNFAKEMTINNLRGLIKRKLINGILKIKWNIKKTIVQTIVYNRRL